MWAAIIIGIICVFCAMDSVLKLSKSGYSGTAFGCLLSFLFLIGMYMILIFSRAGVENESKYEKVTETFYRLKQ